MTCIEYITRNKDMTVKSVLVRIALDANNGLFGEFGGRYILHTIEIISDKIIKMVMFLIHHET